MAKENILITGNEAAVMGAIDAGARFMYGYPITPATEILEGWIAAADRQQKHRGQSPSNKGDSPHLQYLQTEDEIASGFAVLGSVLAGEIAFTASAGPGHILLQDALSMAENLRLPFVGIMMQRGGPSTGTVNYSQQEVNLAAFGGNGDGLRIVYSASSVEEMYILTIEAFRSAWKYRFPTILLGDGYLGKMKTTIKVKGERRKAKVESKPILTEDPKHPVNLRNCYSSEEVFGNYLAKNIKDWKKYSNTIAKSESFKTNDADTLIIAHGLVASAAKEAVTVLRDQKIKAGLFRPITLNPFDVKPLKKAMHKAKKIFIFESALSQLSRIIKYELYGETRLIIEISKPAEGFTPEEIIKSIKSKVHKVESP